MDGPMYFVYELEDPRIGVGFYIGKSTNGMARPRCHLMDSQLDYDKPKANPFKISVILKIRAAGLEPKINILEVFDNAQAPAIAEQEWIAEYRRVGVRLTNLTDGGEGAVGYKLSDDRRRDISKSKMGINNPMFGKKRSEEAKRKTSEALKGEKHPMFGKHHSEEVKAKIALGTTGERGSQWGKKRVHSAETIAKLGRKGELNANFGKPSKRRKPFKDELGNTFQHLKEACVFWGIKSASSINDCLSGKYKQSNGHIFTYIKDTE